MDSLYPHLSNERLLELAVNIEVLTIDYGELFETYETEPPQWFMQLQEERQHIIDELSQRQEMSQ